MTTAPVDPALIEQFVLAAHGDLEKVTTLLTQEPGLLNESFLKFNETALEAAGHVGRTDIADVLIGQGAPLQIFAAAMLGRTEDVRRFLEADPSLAQKDGVHEISLMFHAALSGKPEIAELIVMHGADVPGHALHAAVMKGHLEMTHWLLGRISDVNSPDYQNRTPLKVALLMNRAEIADALRQAGGHE
jgi:uncharacterized protein